MNQPHELSHLTLLTRDMSAKTAPAKATPAPSKPISLLNGSASLIYANVHPALLLSPLLLGFSNLVRDPITTLLALAPSLALTQALYCILCLPSSGPTTPPTPKPGQKKKPAKSGQDIWTKVVQASLSLLLTLFLTTPLLHTILLLFGAPLTSKHPATFLAALHLALLTTPPLFYTHGLDATIWRKLVSLQRPIDEVNGTAIGACVGAWLGAVPIPLDWDREWQAWPITIFVGMYCGAVVGKVLGAWVFRGLKVKMS